MIWRTASAVKVSQAHTLKAQSENTSLARAATKAPQTGKADNSGSKTAIGLKTAQGVARNGVALWGKFGFSRKLDG